MFDALKGMKSNLMPLGVNNKAVKLNKILSFYIDISFSNMYPTIIDSVQGNA